MLWGFFFKFETTISDRPMKSKGTEHSCTTKGVESFRIKRRLPGMTQ